MVPEMRGCCQLQRRTHQMRPVDCRSSKRLPPTLQQSVLPVLHGCKHSSRTSSSLLAASYVKLRLDPARRVTTASQA